jgi:hypothetical protein
MGFRSGPARILAAWLLTVASPVALIAAPAPLQTAEGVVSAADSAAVTMTARAGATVRVAINAETRVIRRQTAKLSDIKPREFIGVAAKRESDGSLTAVAINIFPPEYKGRVREGQFPMETGNLMTNATVFQNVRRIEGRTLYLQFPEGTAVIQVPPTAEINRLTQVRVSDLRPGMKVIVRGTGTLETGMTAASITIDEVNR